MPLGACETGVCRTTSAGVRVRAGAACDIKSIVSQGCCALTLVLSEGVSYSVMSSALSQRGPRWYSIPPRVLLFTLLLTLLAFAVSLLFSILAIVIAARLHGSTPNLQLAYRSVVPWIAVVAGGVFFVIALMLEIRHYRQSKALAEI